MQLPDSLNEEQHAAIVVCLRVLAARGRAIKEAREREQKAKTADALGSAEADLAETTATPLLPKDNTDAN